jgi:hypothetical protein
MLIILSLPMHYKTMWRQGPRNTIQIFQKIRKIYHIRVYYCELVNTPERIQTTMLVRLLHTWHCVNDKSGRYQAENVLQFRLQARHLILYQTRRTGDKQNINRTLISFTPVNISQKAEVIHLVKNLLLWNRRVCHWHITHPTPSTMDHHNLFM